MWHALRRGEVPMAFWLINQDEETTWKTRCKGEGNTKIDIKEVERP
jgi:hypothetical protein